MMGGETRRVMNEFNIPCDPEAAGVPVFMGTFDVSAQLCLSMDEVEKHFGAYTKGPCQAAANGKNGPSNSCRRQDANLT